MTGGAVDVAVVVGLSMRQFSYTESRFCHLSRTLSQEKPYQKVQNAQSVESHNS
jgi:hypothetical protein